MISALKCILRVVEAVIENLRHAEFTRMKVGETTVAAASTRGCLASNIQQAAAQFIVSKKLRLGLLFTTNIRMAFCS